eukprot:jgi/Tetstr1/449883/TSEL_036942.t1
MLRAAEHSLERGVTAACVHCLMAETATELGITMLDDACFGSVTVIPPLGAQHLKAGRAIMGGEAGHGSDLGAMRQEPACPEGVAAMQREESPCGQLGLTMDRRGYIDEARCGGERSAGEHDRPADHGATTRGRG